MTRDETKELLMTIQALYPNFSVKPEQMTATLNAWHLMLSEYPIEGIKGALQIYVRTNKSGFAPSVSQLIDGLHKPDEIEQLTEGEAWALVKRAIQDGNYHAVERFNKLPELVQRAVGNANMIQQWAQTDSDEVNTVVSSNFQRTYKALLSKKEFTNKVPPQIANLVKGITDKVSGERLIGDNK